VTALPAEAERGMAAEVRPATDADLEEIARIYAHYVERTPATFDVDAPSLDEWGRRWDTAQEANRPWYVSEAADGVAGFVVMSGFRPKGAYRATVETTIYLDPEAVGHGLGRPLYAEALDEAARRGFHVAVAGITLPNRGSVDLHESLGFTKVGVFEEVGHKHGDWRDVSWWQRRL
jgi:L-amino acid N-acyltransferase YncA